MEPDEKQRHVGALRGSTGITCARGQKNEEKSEKPLPGRPRSRNKSFLGIRTIGLKSIAFSKKTQNKKIKRDEIDDIFSNLDL